MAEHLTRKELKTDHFAVSVEHAADYFGLHRRQVVQIAGAILVAALLAVGIYAWVEHSRTVRADKLSDAMQVAEAPVGPTSPGSAVSFPNQAAKDAAVSKAFTGIATEFHGSREAAIAEYTLAGQASTAGKNSEARKRFQAAADSGSKEYASLAKLALAQLDFAENRSADGEKRLRDLMEHPTAFVSKQQATITLARMISRTRPAEARALLTPLAKEAGDVGQMAASAQADIAAK